MNLLELQENLRRRVASAAHDQFGVDLSVEEVTAEVPPRTELGDLAFPVAFELAKRIKAATGERRPPLSIAEELSRTLQAVERVARVAVAGAGYLNVFYDRAVLLADFAQPEAALADTKAHAATAAGARSNRKRIVEHTNINPNKAAHIGHLRNAVLGDTFVRVLRAAGEQVEVQNYIDNTGVQVADVVVGFMHIEKRSLADVQQLDKSLPADRPFDYYCWDLYSSVGLFYRHGNPEAKEDAELLRLRTDTLHLIEAGGNPTAELADYVATRVVNCHLDTMARLGVRYDVLPRESEILHLQFWDHAFERLKTSGAIRLETAGRNAGCWVMPTDAHVGTDEHDADKIIVRSNGTVTYAGKDVAYQLWKLGRLGLDFHYTPFRIYLDQHTAWITTSRPSSAPVLAPAPTSSNTLADGIPADDTLVEGATAAPRPQFGRGGTVYNVIDSRQSYTQDVVRRAVAAVAPDVGAEASVHLGYEMVALSPAACAELGIELSEEDQHRTFIEMSGRRGLGVKADDLIDKLEASALGEVEGRHPELSAAEKQETAHTIAIGALRYFLLKWTRSSVIAFDFKEALSFDGETGPYCQYAVVRANSIFRKIDEATRSEAQRLIDVVRSGEDDRGVTAIRINNTLEGDSGDEMWSLVLLAARFDEAIKQAAAAAEPAVLAKYAFQLARSFNLFYHRHRIISEEDATKRSVLITIADIARRQLTHALTTLGIGVPERM